MILKPKPLKGRKNFKLLFQTGIKLNMEGISVYYNPNYDFPLKYGIIVSSKFGKATKRNKIKRQIRHFLREHSFNFLPFFGNLCIFIQKDFNLNYFNLHNNLIKLLMELRKCLKKFQ